MSNTDDESSKPSSKKSGKPYKVGYKHPPLHSQFKAGISGNPKGRPKHKLSFHEAILDMLQKLVSVTKNGKTVKMNYFDLFFGSVFKSGVNEGPQSKMLMFKVIMQALADSAAAEAKAEEAKKLKESNSISNFSWSEEAEKLYQELKDFEDAPLNNDDDDEEPGVQN